MHKAKACVDGGCQYAKDIGVPDSCVGQCQYETYWGEPTTEAEHQLVEDCQRNHLYGN
jgi:hypothetical protein